MATSIFDHPYASLNCEKTTESSEEEDINFKDSPRKVLVQKNNGASLNILNDIAKNHNFDSFDSGKHYLIPNNGIHNDVNDNQNSDEMETTDTNEMETTVTDEVESATSKEAPHINEICGKETSKAGDLNMSGHSECSETDSAKVLDIFLGIKCVFNESAQKENHSIEESKEKEITSLDVGNKNGDCSSEGQPEAVRDPGSETIETSKLDNTAKADTLANESTGKNRENNSSELDTESNIHDKLYDEETDDADDIEDSMDQSFEASNEFTSEIKTGVGNGIIMAVKKKPGRGRKRKSALWTRPSPYKMRRLGSGSPKDTSVGGDSDEIVPDSVSESMKNGNDTENKMVDSVTNTPDQEEKPEEELGRRNRTPSKKDGFLLGEEAVTELDSPSNIGGVAKRRSLLFNRGRRASPSQIKALGQEELDRYKEPFKQGWKREIVNRGIYEESTASGQPKSRPCDVYYFPPIGSKIRSMVQIKDWLATHATTLTQDHFTFMRRAIGVEGEVIRNASQSRGVARKRQEKLLNDSDHVHDDNDGQFDKPEVVIERDSEEFLSTIISAANSESDAKPEPKPEVKTEGFKRGRPRKKEFSNIPNLAELKNEKVEMMQPSNEQVIISPSKKKSEHKATARKSTTQKTFRKPIPYTGVENLCSLKCPGMEGIPPMLHCNVCMCLFHNECVNFYGQDTEFVCLRCKDMQPPSAGGAPHVTMENNIMKVSSPTPLNQVSLNSPNIVRVLPSAGGEMQILTPSSSPMPVSLMKVATPPMFKMLPLSSGATVIPVSSAAVATLSYPLFLTPNTANINSSPASESPKTSASGSVSSTPILSKSQNLSEIVKEKMQTDYPEIRPLIKQEPVDTSYDSSEKGSKENGKNVKASTEAIDNLKSILSSRLASPPGDNTGQKRDIKPVITASLPQPQANSTLLRFMNMPPISSPAGGSLVNRGTQLPTRPRMSLGMNQMTPMQFSQGLVPIGPPIPLNRFPVRMPALGTNFITMAQMPAASRSGPPPSVHKNSAVIVTTQDEIGVSSGPVVVNAKSVTPMNGQLLTLPPPVAKKLTLNKPLALKINNRQITVPPSGFFQSSEGLKVFLPPNTFPTADENVVDVSVTNDKSQDDLAASVPKTNSSESRSSTKSDLSSNTNSHKVSVTELEQIKGSSSAKTTDIRGNKYYKKCCLIQRLYGYDYMLNIFKYLGIQDLLRASLVCRSWRKVTRMSELWRVVRFSEVKVLDWQQALKYVSDRDVQFISLIGMSHFDEPNRTWHQLVSSLQELSGLRKIAFDLAPAAVLQSVAGKLTNLESFCAEKISDFTDDSRWEIPTKLCVGNFKCLTKLQELKLRGTGGLSLPSFSFGSGLADLGHLQNLHTLHFTSLKNVSSSDFHFLSSLVSLRDLAIGDCDCWTHETYSHLQKLNSLRKLRLENGGEIPDTGLGVALSCLTELEDLELCKFTIAYTFDSHISGLAKLKHLTIHPNSAHYMGEVNTNTLKAVQRLRQLKTLLWIIPHTSTSSIILDDNESSDKDELSEQTQQWIPFQALQNPPNEEKGKTGGIEYISVQQLKGKLVASLPDTDVVVQSAKSERLIS